MQLALIRPANTRPSYSEVALVPEPTTQLVLGSAVRAKHAVRLVDLRFQSLRASLADFRPDAFAVGVGPLLHGRLATLVASLKRDWPGARIAFLAQADYGAEHVTHFPEEYQLEGVDALFACHSYHTQSALLATVLDRWEAGEELDDLRDLHLPPEGGEGPWRRTELSADPAIDYGVPDRRLLGSARGRCSFGGLHGTAFVSTSFGCRYACRYCPMSRYSEAIFERDLDQTVAELESLRESRVFLHDYEPLQAPEHLMRLAAAVEARGIRKGYYLMTRADSVEPHAEVLERWQRLGLDWVYLGLDGSSDERLRELRKGSDLSAARSALARLERMGLHVVTGVVLPSDLDLEGFRRVREEVRALDPPGVAFTVETPLPGTQLFEERQAELTSRDWSLFDLNHALLPTKLPLRTFYRELVKLNLWGARRTLPTLLRGFRWSDHLRAPWVGLPRLADMWFAQRHHSGPRGGPAAGLAGSSLPAS